ncbi:MAG TPA: FtsX-like permease family protein, partial [Pseudonocardiaceae bacterium]|nr:FtsX-like permease family protein [Pseudonocardiaceae bacterium]
VPGQFEIRTDPAINARAQDALRHSGVVRGVYSTTSADMTTDVAHWQDGSVPIEIAPCDVIRAIAGVRDCVDGDVFSLPHGFYVAPGTRLTSFTLTSDFSAVATSGGTWTVPAHIRVIGGSADLSVVRGALVVTPKAIAGVRLAPRSAHTENVLQVDPNQPDAIEYVRNALAEFPLQAFVDSADPARLSVDQQTFLALRNALLAGSLFTLLLAGVSLLVLALEQVRERRRPLAMLSAAGVSRSALARSLLWQTAVPVGVGVLAATATGIGLAALVLRMSSTPMVLDWADIGVFGGAAVGLVLLVTAATLPALRNATRLSSLRTE